MGIQARARSPSGDLPTELVYLLNSGNSPLQHSRSLRLSPRIFDYSSPRTED